MKSIVVFAAAGLVLLGSMGVATAQVINANPQTLTFVYQIGGPNPPAQNIFLESDVTTQFSVTVSTAPWLTVSPITGVTPATLVATVAPPASFVPGTYVGSIVIGPVASTGATVTVVPVALQVLASPEGKLQVSPNSLGFEYAQGGPAPPPSTFSVTSTGTSAAFTLTTSAPWLNASASSSATPAVVNVNISPNNGLTAGTYTGFVTVNPGYAGGIPQQVSVTLRVYSPGALSVSPHYLSFNYQPGGSLQSQLVNIVNSTGGSVPYTLSSVTSSGGNWLSTNVAAGTTPSGIVVSANGAGLASGSYYGTVTITPTAAGVTATQIPVALTVYSSSQLLVNPVSLNFNYQQGAAPPAAQYVSVTSTGGPINFNISVQGPPWFTTSALSGTTPTGFGISVRPPSSTPPGTYVASVSLTPTTGGGSPLTIPVTIFVTAPNYLTVGRTNVSFNYSVGGANPAPEVIPVTSSGGQLRFDAFAATAGFGSWLSVSQSNQYTPATLTISVSPSTLAPGTYSGTVIVNSDGASNGQQSIVVNLTVTNAATFTASPFGLVFSYEVNSAPPAPQAFVVSSGSTTVPFTSSAVTTSGGNWLLLAGNGPTPTTLAAAVNATGLAVGTYSGSILVKSNDGSVPVLEVPVLLNVSAAPVFLPSAGQVSFQYQTSGAVPAPQTVTINSNATNGTVYYPTLVTADGGTWLSAAPSVAVTPSNLTISVNPAGLAAGSYFGAVIINDPTGDTPASYVPVSLQISNSPLLTVSTPSISLSAIAGIGGVVMQSISVGTTGPPVQFNVTTSGGNWLSVNPTSAFTGTGITVAASAGSLTPGFYLGLVTLQIPGVQSSQQFVPVIFMVTAF